jgi:hypothetical protein
MNKLKTLGLSALAGSLALTSANAVEFSVSGDAVLNYKSADADGNIANTSTGNGLGVDTDLYFNASGELDNGWTVSFFQAANTDAAWTNSSSQVTIGMGSMGTFQVNNIAGSKANGIDDVMPFAYDETWGATAVTGDNPSFFGSATASGSVDYRIPAQELAGLTINASITLDPSVSDGSTTARGVNHNSVSGRAVTLEIAHDSGLSIGAGQENLSDGNVTVIAGADDEESHTVYAKYAMGGLTVGMQESYENASNGADDKASEMWGIAYTMGDLSVSYAESELTRAAGQVATETVTDMESIQAAYTMGAMTISGALFESGNAGGTAGKSYEATEIAVSFAF